MDERVTIRQMKPGEEPDVCALVARVFDRFVAPGFPPEGAAHPYLGGAAYFAPYYMAGINWAKTAGVQIWRENNES
jgi:hypothetical protein